MKLRYLAICAALTIAPVTIAHAQQVLTPGQWRTVMNIKAASEPTQTKTFENCLSMIHASQPMVAKVDQLLRSFKCSRSSATESGNTIRYQAACAPDSSYTSGYGDITRNSSTSYDFNGTFTAKIPDSSRTFTQQFTSSHRRIGSCS